MIKRGLKVIGVMALCVLFAEGSMAKGRKNDSLAMNNNVIEYVLGGSDVAVSFPQLSVPASSTMVMQNMANLINRDVCINIANNAVLNTTDSVSVSSAMVIDSPAELEMFVLREANLSAAESNELSESVYHLYSEWTAYANNHIVTVFQKIYSFYGGANGVTRCTLNNYSVASGEAFEFADIIQNKKAFMEAVVKNFCKERKLKPSDPQIKTGLAYQLSDLPMPGEIGICKKGLVVIYQQGEIASRSAGVIAIIIPFRDMKDLFHKEFFKVKMAKGSIDSYNERVKKDRR